jgi:hypothetical protein
LDKYVTVAGFTGSVEAEIARGRLESEGIPAFVTGDLTASTFSGFSNLGGRIELRVPAEHLARAVQILSVCGDAEHLSDEARGEWGDEGPVWVCSLCGDVVRAVLPLCPACHTPRGQAPDYNPGDDSDDEPEEGIQQSPTGGTRFGVQPAEDGVKKPVDLTPALPAPRPLAGPGAARVEIPPPATASGDERAWRALRAALFGFLMPVGALTLYSVWTLLPLLSGGTLSSRGRRNLYLALFLDGVFCLFMLVLCAGLL